MAGSVTPVLVTGTEDGTVKVWRIQEAGPMETVALSSSGLEHHRGCVLASMERG